MTEKTYRQMLDETFESDLIRLKPPAESNVSPEQYRESLAVEFALTAARDVTRQLEEEGTRLIEGSLTQSAFLLASHRMRFAWAKVTTNPPIDFQDIKNRTLTLLEDLTSPPELERDQAAHLGPEILTATTEDFEVILEFLRDRLNISSGESNR